MHLRWLYVVYNLVPRTCSRGCYYLSLYISNYYSCHHLPSTTITTYHLIATMNHCYHLLSVVATTICCHHASLALQLAINYYHRCHNLLLEYWEFPLDKKMNTHLPTSFVKWCCSCIHFWNCAETFQWQYLDIFPSSIFSHPQYSFNHFPNKNTTNIFYLLNWL